MSLDVTQAIVIEGRKRDFSQASQRLALYSEEGAPLRLPQSGEHGLSVGYAEHKDPIVVDDTMNVLDDASGLDFYGSEMYTMSPNVEVEVTVPTGGGIQVLAAFDYEWFDTPDNPGDGNGSRAAISSGVLWPTFDDMVEIGPYGTLEPDSVPSRVLGIGNNSHNLTKADWSDGWPIRDGYPGYGVYEFLKPGEHELKLMFGIQQWEKVDGVVQEGTHQVSLSNIKLKAIALA